MYAFLSGLGVLGFFFLILLGAIIIVSSLMWFFVPFWILSIKNSVKNIELILNCPK